MSAAQRCLGAALAAALLGSGCANAILSYERFRSHEAYSEEALVRFVSIVDGGQATKIDALATLGPPIQVIAQESGDVFVYRRIALDTTTLNLNPSMVSYFGPTPPIPLYFGRSTKGRQDLLMLFFDTEGRLVESGQRMDVRGDG